jgi:ribosome-binding factor A
MHIKAKSHSGAAQSSPRVATTQEAREQFLSLQMSWIRLAADLDNAKAFIDAMNEMDEKPPVKAAE